jgi:hypothetical protein
MARSGALASLLLALAATGASGQGLDSDARLADLLDVVVLDREVLAIDAESGGNARISLHLGEDVLQIRSRGRVGVVITDERVLAVGTGAAPWQDVRFERGEQAPPDALLGDRVALVVTSRRAIGFDGVGGRLVEHRFGPHESFVEARTGENVVVVVTSRQALGLSPASVGFREIALQVRERIDSIRATANAATLRTSRRLLVFRGPAARWSEERLSIVDGR